MANWKEISPAINEPAGIGEDNSVGEGFEDFGEQDGRMAKRSVAATKPGNLMNLPNGLSLQHAFIKAKLRNAFTSGKFAYRMSPFSAAG